MSKPLSPETERRLQRLMDLGERVLIVLAYAGFVIRLARSLEVHPHNVIALVAETLVVFFILARRPAVGVSTRPLDWALAIGGTMAPLFARPGGTPLVSEWVGAVVMCTGVGISLWAKISLRRSIGIAAANRGVVGGGAYRWVRHPMYAGYVVFYVGFFLNNPLAWNAGLYLIATALLIGRILAEERLLKEDSAYVALSQRVRHRLIPGVF